MSINLDALAVKEFESEVHHQFTPMATGFQSLGRYRSNVKAKDIQFPVFGYSQMEEHVIGTPIKPANGSRAPVIATLKNYAIGDWTSIFLQQVVNFDEMREFAKVIAQAMENRMVQEVVNAAAGVTYDASRQVAQNVSGANSGMTVAALRAASNILDEAGVAEGPDERVLLVHPASVHNLTKDERATSMFYVDGKPMTNAQIREIYGFDVRKIPTLREGGLPGKGSGTRKNYAYGKSAMGIATGVWKASEIQYYNTHLAHFVSGALSGVAKSIDDLGFVEITVSEGV